jgi:broad specificity phosphatase PhoE
MDPNTKASMNRLYKTRENRSKRVNMVPLSTTPPLNIFQEKKALNKAANLFRSFLSKKEPVVFSSSSIQPPLFEFIFVRHGESCANAIQRLGGLEGLKHKYYSDPELTQKGVQSSEVKSPFLLQILFEKVPRNFSIGSSALLRAQETAYFMLGKQTDKPINVFPHLGEIMLTPFQVFGKRRLLPTVSNDNLPFSSEEQTLYFSQYKNPPFLKGVDLRETPYDPNLQKFMKWAVAHPEEFPEENGIRRVVLFTHSNLLSTQFSRETCLNKEELNPEGRLGNNDFLVTIYNPENISLEKKSFLHPEAVFPFWRYYNTQDLNVTPLCGKEPSRCKRMAIPLNIPVTQPCISTGGKRKTRRLRRRSIRRRL